METEMIADETISTEEKCRVTMSFFGSNTCKIKSASYYNPST
jgi:hypothetical protein